jgi:large conductance mechanosensitive channel
MAVTKKKVTKKSTAKLPLAKVVKLAQIDSSAIAGAGKTELTGFVNFVREQGVVGLAVGLAVGTAAGAAVKQIVDGFINPIVGFLIGGIDLTKLTWVVIHPNVHGKGGLVFSWGAILSSIITLLATAFVIYWLVHLAKLDKLDRKKAV